MPFQTAPRRASCITCRKPIERGDRCYLGERTGMAWCTECAETTLHKTQDVETPAAARVLPSSWTKIGPAAVPSWFERGED